MLTMFCFSLASCNGYNEGEAVETNGKGNYNVKFLFEADGVKVYRFSDNGYHIYFTNKSGKCEYKHNRQVGKQVVTETIETICNDEED